MRIRPIPFPEFRDELLRLYDPPHRATATRRQMRSVLELVAALGVKTTADLTSAMVARFIEARPPGQSPRTLQTVLRVLNQAVMNGYLRVSPFALRRVSQRVGRIGPPAQKKHYSRDEIRRVLTLMAADVASTAGWSQWRACRIYALTATVAYTGLRGVSEALFLHATDIKLEARFIALTDRGRDGGHRLKTEGPWRLERSSRTHHCMIPISRSRAFASAWPPRSRSMRSWASPTNCKASFPMPDTRSRRPRARPPSHSCTAL